VAVAQKVLVIQNEIVRMFCALAKMFWNCESSTPAMVYVGVV
jgi:hypothetical protein